jgi:integral membrane protein
MNLMRILRATSLTEGVSYLLLLGVAMPLKYVWDWPLAVKYVGWAHGVLFMGLALLVLVAMIQVKLPFKTAVIVGIASLLPAGPFFADRLLRRHEEKMIRELSSRDA